MIVFCEDCGGRNFVDPEEVKKSGKPVRCTECNDILKISIPVSSSESRTEEPLPSILELRLGDHLIEVSQTRPSATMGRQEHNDFEIIDTRVSRSHARVEYRKGQFFVIDHSTNGTYVMISGKKGVNLKRKELVLEGRGFITLGRKIAPDSPKAVHFVLK
ncbi:Forkhead-associated domain-containing protein [Desulfonema limicola]|uniref:Forkhead-associated domain-containing protein n=1 Tax=Desulfonema limicola TaxID=45656 RepID=A0A975GGB6_9BACT|nr:FHA domain-containing protein [Desulfonema limicola]QTA80160.1 Forkhead-associated domain-containing protein [Desulfonema limicola]